MIVRTAINIITYIAIQTRQYNVVVNNMDRELVYLGLNPRSATLAVCAWEGHLTFLCPSFYIYKLDIIVISIS